MQKIILYSLCLLFLTSCLQKQVPGPPYQIIPLPNQINYHGGQLDLSKGIQISTPDKTLHALTERLAKSFQLLRGIPQSDQQNEQVEVQLILNADLAADEYQLDIDQPIVISGGSFQAVAMGTYSFLQAINTAHQIARGQIKDRPTHAYRSLMLDLARQWHSVEQIQEIIELCGWYKINYLHLHLTDDQSFTFGSTAYPALVSQNRHYTLAELKDLNQFAYERGVTLIPEIDVPGHATQFVRKRPDLFGIQNVQDNPYTISMGKEAVYEALERLIEELAEAFPHSPYIHIGGDEAFFANMEKDPETIAYMAKHEIPNVDELFRHFLVRLNEMVKRTGKQTLVWAGFSPKGTIEIPKDVIVILWESVYYDPQQLADDGYTIINASFKPLYVVNNRKWSTEYLYRHWNSRRWESWATDLDTFNGVELPASEPILGATMCSWEQRALVELPRLRKRLPVVSEKLWSSKTGSFEHFENRLKITDQSLSRLLHPFVIEEIGLNFSDAGESNFSEHMWFDSSVQIQLRPNFPNLRIEIKEDDQLIDASTIIQLNTSTNLSFQAYDLQHRKVGLPMERSYLLQPIHIKKKGLVKDLPYGSWEKLKFENSLEIRLESVAPNDLEVQLKRAGRKDSTFVYQQPFQLKETTDVRASLLDEKGERVGTSIAETYYLQMDKSSLTTGRPITASNEKVSPGLAKLANNGKISLWEHWGDHQNGNNWLLVDLEETKDIQELFVHTFWDGYRSYQYTIEGSKDGESWVELVDNSQNTSIARMEGYQHRIPSSSLRYLKLNVLANSANPGLHIVEFGAR